MAKKKRTKASATARTVSQLMAATMAVSPIVAALPILPGTAVAEEEVSAPINMMMSGDGDGRLGYLSTTVTVSRLTYAAETAQGIEGYRLYWADYSGIKQGDPIREWTGLTASSGDLNDVMDGVAIPEGTTGLFAVPCTAEGSELDGISLGFTDIAAQTEAIESLTIEVVFNDEISTNAGTISATDFVLTGAGEIHVASAAIIDGRMQLVLSRAMVPGEALTLSYTPPTENKLLFANIGLYVPGFSGVAVYTGELPIIDDTDSAYPNVLHLVMTTALDGSEADPNAFTVKRGGTPVGVQSVHVNGTMVTLTLEKTLKRYASYEVSYSPQHVNDLHRWNAYLPEFVRTVSGPSDFPLPAGITVNKQADDYEFVVPNVPADASVAIYTTGVSGAGYPIVTAPNVGTNDIHATVPIDSLASLNTVYIAFVEDGFESARTPVQFNVAPVAKYAGWATLAAYSNGDNEKPPILLSLDTLFDDVDGDTLSYTYSYTGNQSVLNVDLVTGGLEFAPTFSPGTVLVTVSADDQHGNQTSLNFNVTVGIDSPHASKGNAPGSARIDAVVDTGNGEALKLAFSNQPIKQLPGLQTTPPEGAVAYTSGADITVADLRANPYIGVYTVDALGKVLRFTPVTINESMLQAGLFVTRTDGTALTMNGSQLDDAIVRMNIIGNTYKWKTNIAAGDFVLNGAPEDMSIASVYRISDKVLDVKLAYTGSAIASPWNSMTITANASAFEAGGGSLTSNTIPIAPPAPATPWQSSLSAVGGDGQATVTFSAPIGAENVTLEYADNPSFYGRQKRAVNPADTSVDVTGLTNGQSYWFRLVASGGTQSGTSNVEQIDIGEPAPAAAGVPVIYTYDPLEGQEGTIAPGQSFKLQFNSLLDNRNGQAAEAIRQGLGSDFAGRIAVEEGTDSGWSSQFTVIALDTISLTEGNHRIALAPSSVTNRSGLANTDYIAFDIVGDWSDVRPVLDFGKIGFEPDDYYGMPQIYGQEGAVNQSGATITLYDWDGTLDGEAIDSDYSHLQAVGSASSNEDGSFRFNIGSHDTSKQLVVVAQGRGGTYSSGTYDSGMITGIQPAATKLVNKATPFLTGAPLVQHVQQGSSFTLDVANYFADDDVLGYTFAGGYSTSVINSAYFIDNGKLSLLGGQSGTTAIIVTATDMFGAQASQTFNISVEESAPTALAASQVHYYPAAGTGDTIVISGLSSFWNKTIRVYDAAEGGRMLSGDKLLGGEQAFDGTITYQLHEDLGAAGKDLWVTLTDYGWAESERVKIGKQDRTHELTFVNSFNQAAGFKLNPIATGTLRYVVLDSVDPVPSPTQIASGTDSGWESVDVSGSFNVTAGVDNEFYLLGLDQYAIKRIYAVITDNEGNIFPVLTSFFNVHEAGSVSAGWPDAYEVHSANEALFPYLMPGDLKLKKGDMLLLHFDRPVDSDTTEQKIASALEDMGWNGHYTVEALPVIPSSLAHTFRVHITGAISPMLPVSIELQGVQGFGDEYASEYISFMSITDYPELELVADSTYNDAFHPITLTLPNIGARLDQLPVGQQIQISFEPFMSTNSFLEGGEEEGGEEESDDGLQFVAYDNTITILPGQLPSGEWLIHVTVPGYQTATVEQTIVDSYNVIPEGGDFYIATLFDVEDLQKLQLNGGDVTNDQYRMNTSFDPYSELEYYEVWLKHDYLATLPAGIYTVAVDIGGYEDSYPLSIFNPLVKIAQARGNATLAAEVTLQDLLDAGATSVVATRLDAYQTAIGQASAAGTFDLTSLQTLITDANTSLTSAQTPLPRIASAVLSGWQVAMLTSESVAAPNPATVGPDSFTLIARDEAGNRFTPAADDVHIESVRVESGSIVVRLAGALGATNTVELRPNAEASNHFQNAEHVALTGTSGPLHLLPNVAPVVRELAIDAFGPVLEAQFYVEDDDADVEGTHQIQWYRANEADGSLTPIAGANGPEYHPTAADLGKYIRVLVTPVSLTGVTTGVPVLSEAVQPPPPAISGVLQMIDAGGAANDGKTEIVLSAPASGHSYRYKRWSGVSLKPHVGDLLAGADGWISVQSGDLLEASNHELFAVAEVDGNGQMVGLSFVSAVVAKEPPALTADATNNNVDQPIELSFPDNADWRANVTSVTVKRHSDQAVVNAVYSVLEGKVVLAKGAFAVSGEYVDYDITVLANGYSPTQASQRVLGRSTSPTVYMVSAVNAFTGEDIVNVIEVPAYAEVRVYDAPDADTPIATKTQGSTGGVPVVLTFPGGFPSGLHVVYISLTNHANGLAESERMAYRLPLPVLAPPVSFTDAPGAASDGKTKAAIGSPSVAGHTFRYWKVTGAEIPFPVSGDKATGWSAIVNGQELDAANGQNIIVVEVDDEDTIIAYSVSQAVVKEALASPNDTQITVENSLAAGAVDYVKVVNVPANTTINVYSEGSGDTKLGSAANVQTYAADVRVLINVGFEPLRTSFYVGYSRNGMEDSERTLRYVPTPQLSLTLADVEGAANDGTTKATVAGTGASGHKFYYKLSASALSGIGISSHIAAPEWQLLGGDGYIADATGQYVTVAETDAVGNVVALAGQMAVVANALQAPAAGGIAVVNNAVGEDTVIVANVPAGATVFVNDSGGARIGEAVNTDETPATMSVAIEFGFAPLLAEVRVGFTQEGMEDSLLTSVALPLPSLMEEPGFTYVRGSDYVVKSTIALGVLSEEGHQYRYVLSPDYSPVTLPVIGQSLDSWTEIADGETITANSGQGIGIAEVDGTGRAIRFSAARVNTMRNLGQELTAGITHKLNAIGGFQTFVDREALPAGAQGFSKIEVQTWLMDPVVSNGIAIYSADVYNEQDGFGNAVPYQGMWKTLVILFDAGNHPLGYYIGQADTTARPQELAAPPDFTFVSRSGNQVVSALKLDELETEGHSYKYKLAANYYSMIIPQDLDTTDDWLAVPADGLITANSGQGVGIAEVDADGLVVKFSAVQAGWASDLGVPLEAGAITRKFTPYGFRTFVDRSLLPDEVKGFSRIEVQMWSMPPVVSNGKSIYTVDEYNDQYGYSSGLSNLGVWYPLVVLFDANNHPLGYYFDQVDIADRSPELAAPPDFTYVGSAGSQAISTVALANPGTGHSYKYKLFPDYNSVYVPQAGDATNDWLPVPENGRITANSGQDIGFAEVDADGRVVKFSAARFNTTRQLGVPITTGIVQKLTASGGYRTHITREDLPVEAQGFSKIEVLSWLSPPDVSNGVTIFYTDDYNEQYGYSTGLPYQGMWYPLVILFDASNRPVGYFIGSIDTTLPPALTVVPSAIDAEGSGNDGKTRTVLGAPSIGNAYRYVLANTGDTVDYPHAGDDATAWNELTLESWQDGLASGLIAAAHGRQIGIAEVDGQGKVVRFSTVQAVTMDATPAPLGSDITLTNAAAGADTVTVANVPAGAFVYVYDAAGSELGKAQNGSGAFGSVTVAIQGGLSPLLGKIYVELTQTGKEPSGRTEKIVLAPLPAGVAQLSGSYEDSAKTVITLGAPSAVGNKYRYTLYSGTDDVHIPQAGASLSTMAGIWQTALDGQAIAAEANQLIGIAEVDTSGSIVAFQVAAAAHFQAAPSLQADTTDAFSDVPIEITSASGDPAAPGWWAAASSGAVVTHTVGGVTYELSANQYGFSGSKLVIKAGVLAAGEHQIRVAVAGYTYANVALQSVGGPASEWARLSGVSGTAMAFQAANGAITAIAQLVSSKMLTSDQSIAFELWDDVGTTGRVQLFAGGSSGPYTAQFSLLEPSAGATYRIKVYIVSNRTDDAGGNDLKLSAPVELPVTLFRELDANNDGRVGINDLMTVVLHAPDSIRDVNHDGVFDREDVLALLRQIVGPGPGADN